MYELNTMTAVSEMSGHTMCLYSMTLSPDGALLASGAQDTNAIIWDSKDGLSNDILFEKLKYRLYLIILDNY